MLSFELSYASELKIQIPGKGKIQVPLTFSLILLTLTKALNMLLNVYALALINCS